MNEKELYVMRHYLGMLLVLEPPEAPIMRIVGICLLFVSALLALYWWYRDKFLKKNEVQT